MAKIVSRGDPIEPVYLNNLRVAAHGWGVVSGLVVSQRGAGANMSVDVASGDAWINNTNVAKTTTTNVVITAAHASYDRYDLVVINSSGTISVVAGTAAATSYANDYDLETNNAILLAEVYVPATDTTIEDAQITDKQIISFVDEILPFINSLEEYSNHLGATDNFTQTGTSGNGTATSDATNHEMDLATGITSVGHGRFHSKRQYTPSSKLIVVNFLIQNVTVGAGGVRRSFVGLKADFSAPTNTNGIIFYCDETDVWKAYNVSGGTFTSTDITSLANGDVVTIMATSSKIIYMVNGAVVATHTTNIPSVGLYLGASVNSTTIAATTSRAISIDMMGIKAYQ